MRLLVLGGTVFLSREVAAEAARRGHEVICACRGESGTVPDGCRLVRWDRDDPVPAQLSGDRFDAVVDVARHPSRVRSAVAAFAGAHWVFVSTINVYADESTPGGTPETLPLREPIPDDVDPNESPEAYGGMKVACEQTVLDGAASATVVRPGLIVGPGDPTGRFTYWPVRIAEAARESGEVLAPGTPDDLVQLIDVRDLAAWLVTCAERRTTGVYDGVGHPEPIGRVLEQVADGVDAKVRFTWVPQEFLEAQGVQPWAGDRAVPLWLPRPAYDGMLAHDPRPALAAGLTLRPIAETARDTLAWHASTDDPAMTGIDREGERAVLEAWHLADDPRSRPLASRET